MKILGAWVVIFMTIYATNARSIEYDDEYDDDYDNSVPTTTESYNNETTIVKKVTDVTMITNQIDAFLSEVTSGNKSELDATIMLKPFLQMEKSLTYAPLAVAAMGKLNLMAAQVPDFSLDTVGFDYKFLTATSSFRASVAELSDEGYWALHEAHKGTFELELLMSQVKGHVKDAMQVLYNMHPEAVEELLPLSLNEIKTIAANAKEIASKIVEKFRAASYMQSELKRAALAIQGETELLEIENKKFVKIQTQNLHFADKLLEEVEQRKNQTDRLMHSYMVKHERAYGAVEAALNSEYEPPEPAYNGFGCVLFICGGSSTSGGETEHFNAVFSSQETNLENSTYAELDNDEPDEPKPELPPKLKEEKENITEVVQKLFDEELEVVSDFFTRYDPDIINEIVVESKNEFSSNSRVKRQTNDTEYDNNINELNKIVNSVGKKMKQIQELPASEADIEILRRLTHDLTKQFKNFVSELQKEVKDGNLKGDIKESYEKMKNGFQKRMSNILHEKSREIASDFNEANKKMKDVVVDYKNTIESKAIIDTLNKTKHNNSGSAAEDTKKLIKELEKKKMAIKVAVAEGGSEEFGKEAIRNIDIAINTAKIALDSWDFTDILAKVKNGLNILNKYTSKATGMIKDTFGRIIPKQPPRPPGKPRGRPLPPPSTQVVIEASGPGAVKIGNAQLLLHAATTDLNKAREESRRTHEKKMAALEKQNEGLIELIKLNFNLNMLNVTIEAVTKGLQALGAQEKEWKNLMRIFEEMSSIVDITLESPLNLFLKKANTTSRLSKVARDSVLRGNKNYIFDTAYKANTIAFMLRYQSGIYHQISEDILMPMYVTFGELIAMKDKNKIESKEQDLEDMIVNSKDEIKAYIEAYEDKFSEGITNRIQSLESSFNKFVPQIDEETKSQIEAEQQQADVVINNAKEIYDTSSMAYWDQYTKG